MEKTRLEHLMEDVINYIREHGISDEYEVKTSKWLVREVVEALENIGEEVKI